MCATSHAWPKDFARCFPAMSVAPSRCSFSACVVGLIFLTSLSPRCRGLQHTVSAPLFRRLCWPIFFFFVSEKISYSSTGISEQYLFKQGIWKVVMIYSIIPVESPKTPVSPWIICFTRCAAKDGSVAGTVSLKTLLLLSYVTLWLDVIKCLWLPVAILLFGAHQAFFVVFYSWLWLFV